jgi:molecular chaperone DnaK
VTPLTLGIETEGQIMTPLIERNTTIPAMRDKVFSTAADNQTGVTVKVFQGERKMAHHNRLLGEFNLEGIPPQPRGMPQIKVKFDVDANGILNVTARDEKSGKEASVTIKESSGLSEDEIERMKKDAEAHADEDRRQFELAEARNQADQMCYQLEKLMEEHKDKLQESDQEPLKKAIEKTREVARGEDTAAIKSAIGDLEQVSHAFSKTLYERGGAQPAGGAEPGAQAGPSGKSDDDAIDAEFEVKE